MPSLQQVPSAWQYYGTQTAIAGLVVVLGFLLGWFASNIPGLMTQSKTEVVSTINKESEVNASQLSQETKEPLQVNSEAEQLAQPASDAAPNATTIATSNTDLSLPAQNLNLEPAQNQVEEADNRDTDNRNLEPVISQSQNVQNSVVSPELMKRFEDAMAELEKESSPTVADDGETLEYGNVANDYNNTQVQRVDQLPARVMTRLPSMSFSAHMYASNPQDRWVKLNGIEMGEGEWLDDKLFIERIEPQHVIMLFEGHQFSMRALSEW